MSTNNKESTLSITRYVLGIALTILGIIGAAVGSVRYLDGRAAVINEEHATSKILMDNQSHQIGRNTDKLDNHEERIDNVESMQSEIKTGQKALEKSLGGIEGQMTEQNRLIIDVIKETSAANAYIKSIQEEVP